MLLIHFRQNLYHLRHQGRGKSTQEITQGNTGRDTRPTQAQKGNVQGKEPSPETAFPSQSYSAPPSGITGAEFSVLLLFKCN